MQLFDGNYHAEILDEKIEEFVQKAQLTQQLNPYEHIKELAIIQVGEHGPSEKYVKIKKDYCSRLGIPCEIYNISKELTDSEIKVGVEKIVNDEKVGGVIIQVPLPRESLFNVLNFIPHEKDLDLLSESSREAFLSGDHIRLPPVVRAVDYFINNFSSDFAETDFKKANSTRADFTAAVVGFGFLVGKPISAYLKQMGYEVDIIEEGELEHALPLKHKLVVLASGVPNVIKGEQISEGANVIDFGSSVVNGKVVGDLNMSSSIEHLGTISPSPGGMGPLVVRFLVMNHLGI